MEDFLQLSHFSCGYKNSFVLSDICFSIPKGGFAGIVGPNGSGKTTLLKGITGELKAKKGVVLLNKNDFSALSLAEKARNLAVVSQFSEMVDISVEEYVMMGRIPYRAKLQFFETQADFQLVEKYLKLIGIYDLRNKLITQLSGGELQLASIARALTQEPELLLLDEPTAHLDISHQVQILDLIQKLNKELNLTVIMVIHDLNLAGEYCDYLIMLKHGELYCKGSPEEVLQYTHIEKVYNCVVVTRTNPISGKPVVFLVSEKSLNEQKTNQPNNQSTN